MHVKHICCNGGMVSLRHQREKVHKGAQAHALGLYGASLQGSAKDSSSKLECSNEIIFSLHKRLK